ncbi:MAG TPA: serine/threonine-protein kinase [Polyangia bacterium]
MSNGNTLLATLTLPFKSARTIYEGSSEVRLYRNDVTGVQEIGKRVSKVGLEDALGFKEAELLQRLRHDHLVPVYTVASVTEAGADPLMTVIEMIMPYYPRGSVSDVLARNERLGIGDAVRLARHFLLGLDFLHEKQGVLHRDMKSGNVFIDPEGRGRIGDLGLAVSMEPDGTAEALPGTLFYTAPEAFPTKRTDRRADIYGVGLILHELLNGPFSWTYYDGLPTDDLLRRLARGQRAMKDEHLVFKPHVPPRLRTVVTKAIACKPSYRFATAREMLEALGKAPLIDWYQVGEPFTWEGTVPTLPRVSYQVSATRVRRPDRWRLSGKKKIEDWRRCLDDQDVTDLSDKAVRDFFDQMVSEAMSR